MRADTHEISGKISIVKGCRDFPLLRLTSPWSVAEIYLYGAHVTHFQKTGEPPILFLSEESRYTEGTPIRGGIPVIFPWFGPRKGMSAHGFARTMQWNLTNSTILPEGEIQVTLNLEHEGFLLEYEVTVGRELQLRLTSRNVSSQAQRIENCLHTYFTVGSIQEISIHGLCGATYIDKMQSNQRLMEESESIQIQSETDRVYLNTTAPVEIHDPGFARTIRIMTKGSSSTVVWNPWKEKARAMEDFGDEEYLCMVCVESGNVADNTISLAPGESAVLQVSISC